ncbi:transcription factor Cmr1, partial [Hortaea werneckii]
QGAMNIPSHEARMLTGGLTEACRISLFDLIERNVIMSGDPIVLHSALLFTVQAAWSGDKWQMDIAMGQRGMYFAMLRHSGSLENRSVSTSGLDGRGNTDQLWSEWIQNESRSRLVYSWAMVDQEISLFHDTAPLFSVTEFAAPMPDADRLWHAKSAAEWSSVFEQVHEFSGGFSSVGSGARPLSLHDLFRHFLNDEMISLGIETTPLQLRLLLHPLQSLVCQYGQLLSCFGDSMGKHQSGPHTMTATSTRNRLGEVQSLLSRWFDLAERYLKANPMCAFMQTNLIIFHLISLNAVTNFPEIERLARREGVD